MSRQPPSPPDAVYHVIRHREAPRPYYGVRNVRLYSRKSDVALFIAHRKPGDTFTVHMLIPNADWEDVTEEFDG
jgi:hypothetical protein